MSLPTEVIVVSAALVVIAVALVASIVTYRYCRKYLEGRVLGMRRSLMAGAVLRVIDTTNGEPGGVKYLVAAVESGSRLHETDRIPVVMTFSVNGVVFEGFDPGEGLVHGMKVRYEQRIIDARRAVLIKEVLVLVERPAQSSDPLDGQLRARQDQINLRGVGSSDGILDLTREADPDPSAFATGLGLGGNGDGTATQAA